MSNIIEMMKKEQSGIVLVNEELVIYYNGKEFKKESLANQELEEFILSVTDVSKVSVRNHILEEDKVAAMIIGDLEQTVEEYFVLFCMFYMVSIKPDVEIISSIVGIELDENELNYLPNAEIFSSIVDLHFEDMSNVVFVRTVIQILTYLYYIKQKMQTEMIEKISSSIEKNITDLNNVWQQKPISEDEHPKIIVRGLHSRKTSNKDNKTKQEELIGNIATLIKKINEDLNQTLKPLHKTQSGSNTNLKLKNLKSQLEESSNIIKKLKSQLTDK